MRLLTLNIFALILFSQNLLASKTLIFSEDSISRFSEVGQGTTKHFVFFKGEQKEYGVRTWIDTCLDDDDICQRQVNIIVPSLRFERSLGKRGALVFNDGKKDVVCAYKKKHIFGTGFKNTKKCFIRDEQTTKFVQRGLKRVKTHGIEIFLMTK